MTEGEKNVVKALVAVAWTDGQLADGEFGVIEGLLCGFDASDDEERELLEYARSRRRVPEDIPLEALTAEDRELLLSNAALLTWADGVQTAGERSVMQDLVALLGFSREQAEEVFRSVASEARRNA